MSLIDTAFAVLMVGHSLFGNDGPDMLEQALSYGQGEGTVRAQIINGAPLKYNWDNAAAAEGVNAREELPKGQTTHLILTEALPLANHVQWSDTNAMALAFAGLATDAVPDAQIFVQETWHSLNSGTGAAIEHDAGADIPWRARLDQDLPLWEGIVDAIKADSAQGAGRVALIPAGQAMGLLHDQIAAGAVALPAIDALFADDIHLNDLGHYFVAMVQYAVLTGQDPTGLPPAFNDRYGAPFEAPDADLARDLQRVAWQAVVDYGGVPDVPARGAATKQAPNIPRAPPPAVQVNAVPADMPAGTNDVAIGLASVKDWSVQQPFLNIMKTARPWLGHLPGRYGGMEYEELLGEGHLSADGWPLRLPATLSSIGTLVLTDMPEAATSLAGRYVLRFKGKGVVEVSGRAKNLRYGEGQVSFDYTPGPGSVEIRLQRINRADPLREITVVHTDQRRAFDAGAVFNPDWITHIAPFKALRMMDWGEANNAEISVWADRPKPRDFTYALRGVPLEVMIAAANEVGRDLWVNVPHLADDAYVRAMAEVLREGLEPARKLYVEFSNEVWNWQFTQTKWADEQARARWGQRDVGGQYYGMRAAEVAQIFSGVFAEGGPELINVISTQTGWLGLEDGILNAPLWQAEGNAAPASFFDAYAISGYFGGVLGLAERRSEMAKWLRDSARAAVQEASEQGLTGAEAEAYVETHRYDQATELAAKELVDGRISGDSNDTLVDLHTRVWPYHAQVARKHGLNLIMYEGGSHIVGLGEQVDDTELTAFFHHLNYAPEMGVLYAQLLENWRDVGGQLFNAYSDVYAPTKWGSWGALRHLDDTNPRFDALVRFND